MQVLSKIIIKYTKDVSIIKKLPKIYQNDINKKIMNNRSSYYSLTSNDEERSTMLLPDIKLLLDGIFNGEKQAFNIPVIIKTSTKVYDTFLVARTSTYLLTINQDRIKRDDIVFIKRKNP